MSSEGFSNTALPATRAGITSAIGIENGKFHGEIIATTPCGSNSSQPDFSFQSDIVVRDALGTKPARRVAREKVCGVEGEKNFCEDRFDAGLARFACDDIGDFVRGARRLRRAVFAASRSALATGERPRLFARRGLFRKCRECALSGVAGIRATTSPVAGFTESTNCCAAADGVESVCGETTISFRILPELYGAWTI